MLPLGEWEMCFKQRHGLLSEYEIAAVDNVLKVGGCQYEKMDRNSKWPWKWG